MDDASKTNAELNAEIAQLRQRVSELSAEIARKDATLGESEARYQMLFDNAPEAIFIADVETGILVNANVAAEKLLQKPRDEIIGMHHTELHASNRKAYVQSVFKSKTQTQHHPKIERTLGTVYRSNGEKIPVEITARLITLNNKPHLMGIFHDVSKRKAIESALTRSETLFRRLVEEAHDGILVTDENGKIIVFNATQEKITGFSAKKVVGMNAVDLQFSALPPEKQTPEIYQHFKSAMDQILNTGEHPKLTGIHRYQFEAENGDIHTAQKSAFTIKTDKGYKLISFDRDITEEVETQMQLRILSEAVKQSQNAIIITNRDGIIEYVNDAVETLTGYTSQETIGKTPHILKSSLQAQDFYENLWQTILSGHVYRNYVVNRKKDGSTYTEDKTISPIKDEQGNITHFISVGRDTSKIVEIQDELIESRARYRLATSAGKVGVWDWNLQDQTLYFDEHLKEIFDLDETKFSANFKNWKKLFHPDDVAKVAKAGLDYIEGKAKEYKVTHRKIRKDGSIRWALTRGVALRDENGVVYRMLGTVMDVTELILTQQAENIQRLQAETMQEIALALVSHTDVNRVLEEILRQAKRLVDYTTANIALLSGTQLSVVKAIGYEKFNCADFLNNLSYNNLDHVVHTKVIQAQKAFVLKDTHQNSAWHSFEPTAWIKSYIGVPIILRNQVIGVLQIDSDKLNTFTQQDAERLQPLANTAAIALENARLYEQTYKDAETNQVLLREVNHRVKNNLAALIGLLYIEKRAHPEFGTIMDNVINRVRSMSTAHEMLSATKWEPISLSRLIEQVIRNIGDTQPNARYWIVEVAPSDVQVTATQANNIALIINELATNVIKHAQPSMKEAESRILRIAVNIQRDWKNIVLEFMDNGIGFSEVDLKTGQTNVGLDLVKNLVKRSLLGTIVFSNRNGALIQIKFPMAVGE